MQVIMKHKVEQALGIAKEIDFGEAEFSTSGNKGRGVGKTQ